MHKFLIATICLAVSAIHCSAQDDSSYVKKYNHYAGFQANELFRQILNLSNNNSVVSNPYLLVYSVSTASSGWGAHVGLGYVYKKILDKQTPLSRETKVNDLSYRIGIEKKFLLSRKFEAGVALDYAGSYFLDKTFNISVFNNGSTIDSSATTVTDKTTSIGGGPQFSLGFKISERIMIGTEVTMYYSAEKKKSNVIVIDTVTQIFNNNQQTVTTSNFNSEVDTDGFSFTVPAALFLIVKF